MKPFLLIICSISLLILPALSGERWVNSVDATLVLGQSDFESNAPALTAAGMDEPNDVAVDPTTGKVFVSDSNHNRVLRYASVNALTNGADAEAVFGQTNFTSSVHAVTQSNFFNPRGIDVDSEGRLWVADYKNHRVLRFDDASNKTSGANADGVLGAPDFTDDDSTRSQSGIGFPWEVVVDTSGNLWVGSTADTRVVMFADAANLANGANASLVLGQENFTDAVNETTRDGMITAVGLAISDDGTLFVCDQGNNRILRFDDAANKSNGADADAVLGQPDFTSSGSGTSSTELKAPKAIAIDAEGTLLVADDNNNRIIGFTNAATLADGAAADRVFGQADFDTDMSGLSAGTFNSPRGIDVDGTERFVVADASNDRVLTFETVLFQPDMTIGPKTSKQKGRNRYNGSGAGQKEVIKTDKKEVKFIADVENDGESAETFLVKSRKTSGSRRIRVFSRTGGRKNVTGAAKRGTETTNELLPGAIHRYELKVKPKGSAKKRRSDHKVWIQASSVVDGEKDRVIGFVKNRP